MQWKNTHAPEWSRRWSGERTGTNTISLDWKAQITVNWKKMEFAIQFFQKMTQVFSSKNHQRALDNTTSKLLVCSITNPKHFAWITEIKRAQKNWMLTNIESEFLVSPFSSNHKFPFDTTYSFFGLKRLVSSAEKIRAKKIAGLCARPFETWHKAPLFFQNHD